MRLTRNDAFATLVVLAAAALYGLWQTGTALTGTSTRALALIVFALGWLGCTSDATRMADAYQPGAEHRPSVSYVVTASILGSVATIAGIVAIVGANETMLAVLVVTMVALWLMATIRHAMTVATPREHQAEAYPRTHAA